MSTSEPKRAYYKLEGYIGTKGKDVESTRRFWWSADVGIAFYPGGQCNILKKTLGDDDDRSTPEVTIYTSQTVDYDWSSLCDEITNVKAKLVVDTTLHEKRLEKDGKSYSEKEHDVCLLFVIFKCQKGGSEKTLAYGFDIDHTEDARVEKVKKKVLKERENDIAVAVKMKKDEGKEKICLRLGQLAPTDAEVLTSLWDAPSVTVSCNVHALRAIQPQPQHPRIRISSHSNPPPSAGPYPQSQSLPLRPAGAGSLSNPYPSNRSPYSSTPHTPYAGGLHAPFSGIPYPTMHNDPDPQEYRRGRAYPVNDPPTGLPPRRNRRDA